MKGNVGAGETWTLQLRDSLAGSFTTRASYVTQYGNTLSDIAAALCRQLDVRL